VALHDAALGEFDLDPGFLDRIGIRNGDIWMIERQLPDLFPRLFRLIKPLGGEPDIVFGQSYTGRPIAGGKAGCGNMINMLNVSDQIELGLLQCKP
jgi:hypothetical protein